MPENVAAVRTLLGDLELARGRLAAARHAYAAALSALPGHIPARAGRARLAAVIAFAAPSRAAIDRRGVPNRASSHRRDWVTSHDLDLAIARWRRVVARLPLPEYAVALGEAELAAGRRAAARRDLALVRAQQRLLAGAGVGTDVEMALFEADHGDPQRGLGLARRAWANAPSVRSADAVGWALTRSGRPVAGLEWAQRALKLGSVDPLFRFHAGMAAVAAGDRAGGRRELRTALAHGLATRPWQAQRALRELGR